MESGIGGDFRFGIAYWTLDIFGSLGGASENLRDPCNSAMESVSITQYPRIRPKVWTSSSLFERRFSYGHVFVARGQLEITRVTFRWKREERGVVKIVRYFFLNINETFPSHGWNGFREWALCLSLSLSLPSFNYFPKLCAQSILDKTRMLSVSPINLI